MIGYLDENKNVVEIDMHGPHAELDFSRIAEPVKVKVDHVEKFQLSTVFLGATCNGDWFETAAFVDSPSDGVEVLARYSTYDQALRGHNIILAALSDDSNHF